MIWCRGTLIRSAGQVWIYPFRLCRKIIDFDTFGRRQHKEACIVYHVLKGQIEYDFELGRFEELSEKLDIPVFRLETDYNYQDIEQLRIRLEAFSEILNQRRYRRFGKETVAV